jgi:hypothetical protein
MPLDRETTAFYDRDMRGPRTRRHPVPPVRLAGAVVVLGVPVAGFAAPAFAGAAVVPQVSCVVHDPVSGLGGARFGYRNDGPAPVTFAPGSSGNFFSPAPVLRGQPDTFLPGEHPAALTVLWDLARWPTATWILDRSTATATPAGSDAPVCSDLQPTTPTASATGATGVTRTTATLAGAVAPGGRATVAHVEWGTDPAQLDRTGPAIGVAAGASLAPVALPVSGLAPGTTYAYRVVARNAQGTTQSATASFTTSPGPAVPVALTMPAEDVTRAGATLTGVVDPVGEDAVWWFEHGTGDAPDRATPETGAQGPGPRSVSAAVDGLPPGTPLRYRLVVRGPGGTVRGAERTVTTQAPPGPVGMTTVTIPVPVPTRPVDPPTRPAPRDPDLRVTVRARVRGTTARIRVRTAPGARGRVAVTAVSGRRRATVVGPRGTGAARAFDLRLRPGRWVVRVRFAAEPGWLSRTVTRTVRVVPSP